MDTDELAAFLGANGTDQECQVADLHQEKLAAWADLDHPEPGDVTGAARMARAEGELDALREVLAILATAHAGHPDYRAEWRA